MNSKLPKIDNVQISTKIKKTLIDSLKSGAFQGETRFPTEKNMAEQLGVSRTVLRDALGALEAEGYITRRRSIGTTINQHIVTADTRIDLQQEFQEIIRNTGHEAGFRLIGAGYVQEAELFSEEESVVSSEKYLRVEKLFTADGEPAILSADYVPESIILEKDFKMDVFNEISIFEFLEEYCSREAFMSLSDINPICPSDRHRELLKITDNSPALGLRENVFDIDQNTVVKADVVIKSGIFNLQLLRKKI